ncbi:hypothetical protein [Veillonella sp.]|uniref:hypothetical protein n=1 Tax=Veillonella sp. TaxID=1926307 RepID=UPI0025CC7EA5|nr:hypothetical protein [Veillonella sp.]
MEDSKKIMVNLDNCYREICKLVHDEKSELALDILLGINLLRQRVSLEIDLTTLKDKCGQIS